MSKRSKLETMDNILIKCYKTGQENRLYISDKTYEDDFKKFYDYYIKYSPEKISWIEVCKEVEKINLPNFQLILIITLLREKIYQNEYSENLYEFLSFFEEVITKWNFKQSAIFCGDKISRLVINNRFNKNRYMFIETNFSNQNLYLIYKDFLYKYDYNFSFLTLENESQFEKSLGNYQLSVNSPYDFNEKTFWTQVNHYKKYFELNDVNRYRAIRFIIAFYKYLVIKYRNHSFFKEAFLITESLLFLRKFPIYIFEDVKISYLNNMELVEGHKKIVFILKGYDSLSTTIKKEDSIYFNFSKLENEMLRKEIITYIIKTNSISILGKGGVIYKIISVLIFILELKNQPNYPNPVLEHFSNQEAVLIRNYINNLSLDIQTRNSYIGDIRRFLKWERLNKKMTFDTMFFDYLSQFEVSKKSYAHSIPDNELVQINNLLANKAMYNHDAKLCYSIFHLLLQTEFRINQLLHLKVDCLSPSIKPNQFIIRSVSKTSNGQKREYVITDLTYRNLSEIIYETQRLRKDVYVDELRNYIFLSSNRKNSIKLLNSKNFNNLLKSICIELGLQEVYTASNLRDTHMTKSFEYILRNGKSDVELSILTSHKYSDTTHNHYIELELEKILEKTYGIIIGDVDYIHPENKVVKKLPKKLNHNTSIVENGCGNCTLESCNKVSPLPCLACDNFITTISHEKYFIREIEKIDLQLKTAITIHEKDDLNTKKLLYVLYLKAIYKLKGGDNND